MLGVGHVAGKIQSVKSFCLSGAQSHGEDRRWADEQMILVCVIHWSLVCMCACVYMCVHLCTCVCVKEREVVND